MAVTTGKVPRIWPGFLAIWVAVALHCIWFVLLLLPGTKAGEATPVHAVVDLAGSQLRAALLFGAVAVVATIGTVRHLYALEKIFYVLPQQLVLGISAAGSAISMYHSHYADGVARPGTFIVADQLAIMLTWVFHTAAIAFLVLIHQRRFTMGGYSVPTGSKSSQS